MTQLKFKTRGNSSPDKKAKVYFCCHPDDFNRYFESVSSEILALQDCAIWYDDNENSNRDELYYNDLKQMLLFVMPVTAKLLYKPCRAMDEDFKFAIENHIPVLPLMMENTDKDLIKAYTEKFGSLQYLSKEQDETAISYEEKLKKYLASILLDDETVKKIQDAFDAYIFLSYRKKDRLLAQQLMRLIHENEFCRDIAIWYDEFLIPGENFNDSIKEALDRSGLFVLAVTPNLVNETNYIMTTEYPMAKESGKPILPAEMEKTDRAELAKNYIDIPECADARDSDALSEALLKKIESIAIKENDKNPQHNFFIGLAYLNGIDVEVNHERALSLITFAAENGIVEAMNKLIEMYNKGFGTDRDFKKAILWREKKIEHFKKIYENSPTDDNFNKLFWAITYCGDAYNDIADVDSAKEKYLLGLEHCNNHKCEESGENNLKRNNAVSYARLGDICKTQGKLEEAKDYYEKAFEIDKALVEETGTIQSRRDLSLSYDRLGDIYKSQGKLEEAKDYYEKFFEIAKSLAEETGTVKSRRDLSLSYERLGDIYKPQGRLEEAKDYYEKALDIRKSLYEETGTIESRRDLFISYNRLGDIYKSRGRLEKAKDYYEKSFEIAKSLAEETGTIESRRDLSSSYNNLGNICRSQRYLKGKLEEAKDYYEKSFEIAKSLAEETGTIESRRDLSLSYNRLGGICKSQGKLEEAKDYYEKFFEIAKAIAEETGTIESRRDLSISYNRLGDISESQGKLEEAKDYYEKTLEIVNELCERCPLVKKYDRWRYLLKRALGELN